MSTLQQVAAAAGTALFISVMALVTGWGLADGLSEAAAQADGIRAAFAVAAVISASGIVLASFIQRPDSTEAPAPAGH